MKLQTAAYVTFNNIHLYSLNHEQPNQQSTVTEGLIQVVTIRLGFLQTESVTGFLSHLVAKHPGPWLCRILLHTSWPNPGHLSKKIFMSTKQKGCSGQINVHIGHRRKCDLGDKPAEYMASSTG